MKECLLALRDKLWNRSKELIGNPEARNAANANLCRVRRILLMRYGIKVATAETKATTNNHEKVIKP